VVVKEEAARGMAEEEVSICLFTLIEVDVSLQIIDYYSFQCS
jgi:hypothetical protein